MTSRPAVGWREWAALPDLIAAGGPAVKAKIDTGAKSSALHAFGLELVERDGATRAVFEIHPHQGSDDDAARADVPVTDVRLVRSSNGSEEERPVITTRVTIGTRTFTTEMTLTNRDEMGFRMLLGRSAIKRRFVVDPARSFVAGQPPTLTEESS